MMRILFAAFVVLAAGSMFDAAKADPYRWCADYGGRTGGTNCWFVTLEQCRWAISGMTTSVCRPNPFYDGVPIDGERKAQRRAKPRT
jgi:hypothetical protein